MPRRGYTSVGIQNEMVSEIDDLIKSKKYSYTSRGEFIRDAVRRLFKDLKK